MQLDLHYACSIDPRMVAANGDDDDDDDDGDDDDDDDNGIGFCLSYFQCARIWILVALHCTHGAYTNSPQHQWPYIKMSRVSSTRRSSTRRSSRNCLSVRTKSP